MNTCFNNLIALKSLCPDAVQPLFYLDDIEGMTQDRLSKLATPRDGSGAALAQFLIESSVRLLLADIDSVIPANYKIKQELSSVCSLCTFSGFYSNATVAGTGIIIKNMSNSRFTSMIIDSLKVKVNTSGLFVLRIKDAAGVIKDISQAFIATEELTILNIGFETTSKTVQVYFTDTSIAMYTITCPANSSCGCGGAPTSLATDIVIGGLTNGVEGSTQYGILPCVKIKCSYDDIICDLVKGSPRLFGLALLYLTASKSFEENALSNRVNRAASFDKETMQTYSEYYYALYRDRLTGNPKKQVLGIAGVVNQNLKLIKDKCVACDNPLGIAWATG